MNLWHFFVHFRNTIIKKVMIIFFLNLHPIISYNIVQLFFLIIKLM